MRSLRENPSVIILYTVTMANIEIKNIPGKGRGIITTKPIKEGEVVRISDCIPVTDRDCNPHSVIRSYWFIDKSGREFLIALDWTSFMNHDDNANVDYRPINATQIKFVAIRNINAGEELTINYGYDPSEHNKDIGIDMEQWNALTKTFDGGTGVSSAAAASTMGTDLGEANVRMMVNKPEFRGVLTKIRRELEGAPRDTKSAFNVVLEYFAKPVHRPTGKGGNDFDKF